jgi:hypothetical protein
MGQYQQWLSAQEVRQRLKVEKETLETELLYLRERIAILEQSLPEAENVILQALREHLQLQPTTENLSRASTPGEWNDLPKLETPLERAEGTTPTFPVLYSQMERGADMLAFFDSRGQTEPQVAAWHAGTGEQAEGEEHLIDEETRRLNESIQRWFVRWHRQITSTERSEEARHE